MEKDLNDRFSKIPVYVGILKEKGRENKIETWKTLGVCQGKVVPWTN